MLILVYLREVQKMSAQSLEISTYKIFRSIFIFMIQLYGYLFLMTVLTFFALLLDTPELGSLIQTW